MRYTNLPSNSNSNKQIWSKWSSSTSAAPLNQSIKISEVTYQKRKQLTHAIDQFANFTWNDLSAFENFGAFIINDKQSLKFYNGASYSNEYTSPQFAGSTNLIGVTFKTQTISFKVGIYWFSIEEYRQFLNWLSPYVINYLAFDFNKKFAYQVKLSNQSDSTRYIVGYEDGEPRYYTEMDLTFDVQGTPCARAIEAYVWEPRLQTNSVILSPSGSKAQINSLSSELDIPLKLTIPINLKGLNETNITISNTLKVEAIFYDENKQHHQTLFSVILKNLPWTQNVMLYLEYDSESGIIYQKFGNESYKILNRLNNINGEQIVDFLTINKFMIPGKFTMQSFDFIHSSIEISFSSANGGLIDLGNTGMIDIKNKELQCETYARTNVI